MRNFIVEIPNDAPLEDALFVAVDDLLERVSVDPINKALKTGGRAHRGMPLQQVQKIQSRSHSIEEVERDRFEKELTDLVNNWSRECTTWHANHRRYGKWASEKHLDKVQRSYEAQSRVIIRKHYYNQWENGRRAAGNMLPIPSSEMQQLQNMQRNEQQFFVNLLRDVRHGTWGMSPWIRIPMYADASKEAFYAGKVLADLSADVYWQWQMNADGIAIEHCGDCQIMASGGRWKGTKYAGTYSAVEMSRIGVFPNSGQLMCCTHCHCALVKVERPPIAPVSSKLVTHVRLRGVNYDVFGTKGRKGRERLREHAQRYRWSFGGRLRKSIDGMQKYFWRNW